MGEFYWAKWKYNQQKDNNYKCLGGARIIIIEELTENIVDD